MPTYYSGYIDVLWIVRRGNPAARFRLSTSPSVGLEAQLGNDGRDLTAFIEFLVTEVLVIRLDLDLAAAFVMVSLVQQAVVDRLQVAVAFEVPGDGTWAGHGVVTDLRLIAKGGEFKDSWDTG